MSVLVVGGGFAGLAAAWALERRGREVTLCFRTDGASLLYSGALDRTDWAGPPDPRPLSRDAEAFLAALGAFAEPTVSGGRLATGAGVVRPARCHDRALLDLEPLRGRRIDVVDFRRPGWDAAALARAWSVSNWARVTRSEFRPLQLRPAELTVLQRLEDNELAACCDDPAWAGALGDALRGAGDSESPLLLGPWLGLVPGSVERVRERARRPLGETLSGPGGAAGFRFEAAREAWLSRGDIRVERGEVLSLRRLESGVEARLKADGENQERTLPRRFSEVILAVGGVTGGGIQFLSGPGQRGRSFSLSVDAPVQLRLNGREVALESGALGADLQSLGLGALNDVGLFVDERQQASAPDLFAAGDVVADRPRTALEAVYAGIAAARGACRVAASESPQSTRPA